MFKHCFITVDGHAWSKLSVAHCGLYGSITWCALCVTVAIWTGARELLGTTAGLAGFIECRSVRHWLWYWVACFLLDCWAVIYGCEVSKDMVDVSWCWCWWSCIGASRMVDGSWKGVTGVADGSWEWLMVGQGCNLLMEDSWLQGDRLQGSCLVWLGTVVWGCNCVLMALLRAVVKGF